MKIKRRFLLILLLTLVFTATLFVSCSHEEEIPSEDLFFNALELAASGNPDEAAATFAQCLARKDDWAAVSADQLLELLSDNPFLEVDPSIIRSAREYQPLKSSTLRIQKDYDLTFSALTLSGFSCTMIDEVASSWLVSDIDRKKAASLLAEAASLKDTRAPTADSAAEKWLLLFYAGRLYEKNGASTWQAALANYSEARSAAYTELTHDRALWYFLELLRKSDLRQTVVKLPEYAATWNDSTYFDDFLDRLASDLLSVYDWDSFVAVYINNGQYFSAACKAKYACISARLSECGLCKTIPQTELSPADLYKTVIENAEHGSYYDLVARYMTGRPFPEPALSSQQVSDKPDSDSEESAPDQNFAEHLLGKLIERDYYTVTDRYLKEYCPDLSASVIKDAYNYLLSKPGATYNYLSLTSLALKTVRSRPEDDSLLTLAYPPYYRTLVETNTRDTAVEPWLLFALIHSESCFQADISSVAGAHGLTQLMDSTAGDVARKLKMSEYDLDDADTNVKFGCFYMNELIGRLDGNILLAAFSYNAGITRVRNWRRQAPDIPLDIFLETLPYEETRLYGQKITRAAVMYGMLYYNQPYNAVIESIMQIKH